MFSDGTIIAQTSAPGVARRGIVRLSGDDALRAAAVVLYPRDLRDDLPPTAQLNEVADLSRLVPEQTRPTIANVWVAPWGFEERGRLIRGALYYWPRGRGFTGEQAVEIHTLGSQPALNATIRTICASGRARLAERGEFTLRAFLSGRIDLTQAEATLGAINASSDKELQTSLKQLSGTLSREFDELRDLLLDALSELEAGFDFVDEDIEFITRADLRERVVTLRAKLNAMLERAQTRVGSDQTPRVLLLGAPNVGKSSLFNALGNAFAYGVRENALVSDVAGTTRDYLEAELVDDGVRFTLVDAAGLEQPDANLAPSSPRALAQAQLAKLFDRAELILACYDSPSARKTAFEKISTLKLEREIPILEVVTKCDDLSEETIAAENQPVARVSARSGCGVTALARRITNALRAQLESGEIIPSTALRCQEALRNAIEALENALRLMDEAAFQDDFLIASELRLALEQLGLVTGRVHTEDLLDRIFSRFCIGK